MDGKRKLAGLDGLRGICCLGIVLYHIHRYFASPFSEWLWPVYRYGGYFGNYMFFLISGLLIAFHHKKEITEKSYRFFPFLKHYWEKIYFLYFFSNAFMLLTKMLQGEKIDIRKICITFLMGSNSWISQETPYNTATWFLCVLMLNYLLYYWVVRFSRLHPWLYRPLCILLVVVGIALEIWNLDLPFLYRACGEGYMCFFAGALLAELLAGPSVKKHLVTLINGIGLCIAVLYACLLEEGRLPGDMRCIILLICINLICLTVFGKFFQLLFEFYPIRSIGKYSFFIFVWHIPIVQSSFLAGMMSGLSALGAERNLLIHMLLVIGVSALLHFVFTDKTE